MTSIDRASGIIEQKNNGARKTSTEFASKVPHFVIVRVFSFLGVLSRSIHSQFLHLPANRTKVTRVTFRLFDYIRTVHSEFTRQSPPAISTGKVHFTSLPALNNPLFINSSTDTSILFNNRARTVLSFQLHT